MITAGGGGCGWCDICPYSPTCEEEYEFLGDIFGFDEDED
jgi:hypothetical protein